MEPKGFEEFSKNVDRYKELNGEVLDRLQIIFPGDSKYAEITTKILKNIGFFSNDEDTYIIPVGEKYDKILDDYITKKIKFKKILIGTHGSCSPYVDGLVLNGNEKIGVVFLNKIKNLVNSNSHVYLTSCNAAGEKGEYLLRLYRTAHKLKCKVTGSSGINQLGYSSENGFYTCSPEGSITGKLSQDNENTKKYCSFSTSPPFTF
jgi:hypothetical protein